MKSLDMGPIYQKKKEKEKKCWTWIPLNQKFANTQNFEKNGICFKKNPYNELQNALWVHKHNLRPPQKRCLFALFQDILNFAFKTKKKKMLK